MASRDTPKDPLWEGERKGGETEREIEGTTWPHVPCPTASPAQ